MKWQGRRGSRNIEDRRGSSAGRAGGIGGVGLVVVLVLAYFLGIDPSALLQGGGGGTIQSGGGQVTQADEQAGQFVSVTLADTEEIWAQIFENELQRRYVPPTLVLFKGATQSSCGGANGATGPFYCPVDKKVYLDTDFFTMLSQRLGAKGAFVAAFGVAHEVAHTVQT